jgi:NADH-quinone oxidoreductase subunit N
MTFNLAVSDFVAILPVLILCGMGLVVLLFELFGSGRDTGNLAGLTLLSLAIAGYASFTLLGTQVEGFGGTVAADDFALAFGLIFLAVTALTVLLSMRYLPDRRMGYGEYYALLLFATAGMMLMAASLDLLMIFIGLEILSLSSYVLCGMLRRDLKSNESALKYFLLGAFATGFLLYGIVLIYGATGTIHLHEIAHALGEESVYTNPFMWVGLGMLLVGFGFKIALAPFHMWTPDVYEGAPTPVTAFLSSGPKAAGFAALIRILVEGLGPMEPQWSPVLWLLAVVTMTLGNVVAIQQDNIKRMLAYSSIAHAGYILAALVVGGPEGLGAVLFYSLAYTFMNTGAFGVLVLASDERRERLTFEDFRGFGFVSPVLGLAMFVFMLSLAGIPLTAGFAGKFQIFKSAIDRDFIWLAVIGVLNSVVSIYYYLRMVVVMYMQPAAPESLRDRPRASIPVYAALAAAVIGVLYLGIFPTAWVDLALHSVSLLVAGR